MQLGHTIVSERDDALAEKKQKSNAKAEAKKKETVENEAAEDHLGLKNSGRGVSAPSGVDVNDNVRKGLAALGRHTSSHTGELLLYLPVHVI